MDELCHEHQSDFPFVVQLQPARDETTRTALRSGVEPHGERAAEVLSGVLEKFPTSSRTALLLWTRLRRQNSPDNPLPVQGQVSLDFQNITVKHRLS